MPLDSTAKSNPHPDSVWESVQQQIGAVSFIRVGRMRTNQYKLCQFLFRPTG